MKKLAFAVISSLMLASCGSQADGYKVNVQVTGDLDQLNSDTVYVENKSFADTAVLVNGKAVLKGNMQTPNNVTLYGKILNKKYILANFYLENATTDIKVELKKDAKPAVDVKVTGGEFNAVKDSLNGIWEKEAQARNLDSLEAAYKKCEDKEQKAELYKTFIDAYKEVSGIYSEAEKEYLANHPVSLYSLNNLSRNVARMPLADAEAKVQAFQADPAYATNANVEKVAGIVATLKALQPGNKAPEFTQNDPEGNPVKLSDVYSKNKVTMIDFWASWCGPCRRFNPTLLEIYKKYHKKGFEVLGVSFDSKKDAWLKGIKDDKLPWVHVSDLGGWNNAASDLYYIKAIPGNCFVDQNGIIIAYDMNKADIEKLLDEHLTK